MPDALAPLAAPAIAPAAAPPADDLKPPADHRHGHRQRLRQRFLEHGGDSFVDYELLELALFGPIPRRDVRPLAKQLIARFGSFAGVLNAPMEALVRVDGLGETAAASLKVVQAAAQRLARQEVLRRPVIASWQKLLDYLHSVLAHRTEEHFRVLFLDRKNQLIADEEQGRGTVDQTPAYPREIIRRCLELRATAVILVHNHPSGDPSPSQADIALTRDVMRAAEALEITVHDHLIIGRHAHSSLRALGLMAP